MYGSIHKLFSSMSLLWSTQIYAMDSNSSIFDIVNATVNLTDTNDNTPVFEQQQYDAFLPENSPPGTHVVNIYVSTKKSFAFCRLLRSIGRGGVGAGLPPEIFQVPFWGDKTPLISAKNTRFSGDNFFSFFLLVSNNYVWSRISGSCYVYDFFFFERLKITWPTHSPPPPPPTSEFSGAGCEKEMCQEATFPTPGICVPVHICWSQNMLINCENKRNEKKMK